MAQPVGLTKVDPVAPRPVFPASGNNPTPPDKGSWFSNIFGGGSSNSPEKPASSGADWVEGPLGLMPKWGDDPTALQGYASGGTPTYPGDDPDSDFPSMLANNPHGWGNSDPLPVWQREPLDYQGEISNSADRPSDPIEAPIAEAISPTMGAYYTGQAAGDTINAGRDLYDQPSTHNAVSLAAAALPLAASMLPFPGMGHNMPPEGKMIGIAERPGVNNETGFYSALTAAARDAQMKQGNPQQWMNHFKDKVKADEMRWSGMTDFLKSLPPNQKVSRDDVLAHAQYNEVMPSTHQLDEDTGQANSEQAYENALDEAYRNYAARPSRRWIEDYKNEEGGRWAVAPKDNDPDFFEQGQDGSSKFHVVNQDDTSYGSLGDKEFDSKEAAQRHLDDYIRDLDPVSDIGEDEIPWEIYDPTSGSVHDTIEPRRDRNTTYGGYRPSMQDRADEWISEAASNDAFENANSAAREAPSLTYMGNRPSGGKNYADIVLGMDRDVLKRHGIDRGIGAHFFDEEANNVPPDVPGWGLTEEYHDRATNQRGLGVHEQQSDWQQKGQDQGFKGSDPAQIEAAEAAYHDSIANLAAAEPTRPFAFYAQRFDVSGLPASVRNSLRTSDDIVDRQLQYADRSSRNLEDYKQRLANFDTADNTHLSPEDIWQKRDSLQRRMTEEEQARQRHQKEADDETAAVNKITSGVPQIPVDQANAMEAAYQQADLRVREADQARSSLKSGISPGPWVTDQAATHRMIGARMMHEAAKRGLDWVGVSSPDMVAARWGERGYTQPLYGKTLPNIYRDLARQHAPKADLEKLYPGAGKSVSGSYDLNPADPQALANDPQVKLPLPGIMSSAPAMRGATSQRVDDVRMGPARDPGNHIPIRPDDTPAYWLTDKHGYVPTGPQHTRIPSFKTREAAEEAKRQINEGLDNGFRAPTPEELKGHPYMTGVRLTPEMRESILKRGFKSFRGGGGIPPYPGDNPDSPSMASVLGPQTSPPGGFDPAPQTVQQKEPWNFPGDARNLPDRPSDPIETPLAESLSPTMGAYSAGELLRQSYDRFRQGDLKGSAAAAVPLLAMALFPGLKGMRGKLPEAEIPPYPGDVESGKVSYGPGSVPAGFESTFGSGAPRGGLPGPGSLPGSGSELAASGRASDPYSPIPGIPASAKIPGHGDVEARPVPWLVDAANAYMRGRGAQHDLPQAFGPVDKDRGARIAQAYEDMQHDPTNPEVRRSYDAMAQETLDQYRRLKEAGAHFQFNKPGEDPYAASPAMGYPEMRDQRSLSVFPTAEGYGNAFTPSDLENNPLLKGSGEKFGDTPATINDIFRAVHDAYGHYAYGNPFFRAPGEERAWMLHSGMYSPEARGAMSTELRGQNSWVNWGPHGEHNRSAKAADIIYAPQKIGVMPTWASEEGRSGISLEEAQKLGLIDQALRHIHKRWGGAVEADEV